ADVVTIEGLRAADGSRHPMQQAFLENFALQCGYCTPGMLITAIELLQDNPNPTEQEVREALSGNICRCSGYQAIVDAVLIAARKASAVATPRQGRWGRWDFIDVRYAFRQSAGGRPPGDPRRGGPSGRGRWPLSQRHQAAGHVPRGFSAQSARARPPQ